VGDVTPRRTTPKDRACHFCAEIREGAVEGTPFPFVHALLERRSGCVGGRGVFALGDIPAGAVVVLNGVC